MTATSNQSYMAGHRVGYSWLAGRRAGAVLAPSVTRRLIADFARRPRPEHQILGILGVLTHR
jgi:hypothetical protein